MQAVNVIRGHLTGPTTVELDEPAPPDARDAEVWLKVTAPEITAPTDDVFSFLRTLPLGTSTKDQIDARVRAERDEWEGR
jgi:hypothetical protein